MSSRIVHLLSFYAFLVVLLLGTSCKTKKSVSKDGNATSNTRTERVTEQRTTEQESDYKIHTSKGEGEIMEESPDAILLALKESNIRLNYRINKENINDTFNAIIDTLLSNELLVEGMDITLEKEDRAQIEIEGKKVLIQIPLKVTATKETFFQKIKGDGSILFYIVSNLDIDQNWNLTSRTSLESYEWTEQPKMKLAGFDIPIKKVMNIVIEKTKDGIIYEIDRTVRQDFQLREQIIGVMYSVSQPILLDETSSTTLKIHPGKFYMSGTRNTSDWTEGIIKVTGKTHITHNAKFESRDDTIMPPFLWMDEEIDSSDLYFNVDIDFDKINKLVESQVVGRTFADGDKEIKVKGIELKGYDEKIGIIADVVGSYNGQIFLSGIPDYDKETKSLKAKDIKVKVLTKNVLHKALAWMLKGRIKKELDDMLIISLRDNIQYIQSMINQQIETINEDESIDVLADIKDLDITKLKFSEQSIHTTIHVPLYLELKIYDLFGLEKYGTQKQTFSLPD